MFKLSLVVGLNYNDIRSIQSRTLKLFKLDKVCTALQSNDLSKHMTILLEQKLFDVFKIQNYRGV